ncbi:MAG: asparagine synthase [Firmicutes bacterium]|nr:asparagine synthase [Bacillota bacterium]
MQVREGLIPTALGTAVSTGAYAAKKFMPETVAWGVIGFGLAHVVLGSIDLVQHRENGEKNYSVH